MGQTWDTPYPARCWATHNPGVWPYVARCEKQPHPNDPVHRDNKGREWKR